MSPRYSGSYEQPPGLLSDLDLLEDFPMSLPVDAPPRPSKIDYALMLAAVAATRSEDPRTKVGAVVLRADGSVAATGYNGAPANVNLPWDDENAVRLFSIHAEINALRYCLPREIAGGLIAVTRRPCPACCASIAAFGIRNVYYSEDAGPTHAASPKAAALLGLKLIHV